MLDTLITSKTRVKLLMKFFLNPGMTAHLRGLQEEFNESTNGIRLELNRLEEAGMLVSQVDGQKKMFRVATDHPIYNEINSLVRKYFGIDRIIEQVVEGLGGLERVYLIGDMAEGRDVREVSLVFLGDINKDYLSKVISKTEELIQRRLMVQCCLVEDELHGCINGNKHLLLWSK